MKRIKKNNEPLFFSKWKTKNKNLNLEWSELHKTKNKEIYEKLKETLIKEQQYMCCYCEKQLNSLEEISIEHIIPQSKSKKNIFNFENILASCRNKDSCNHKKENNYSTDFISPLDKNCEKHFTYTLKGEIIPKNEKDSKAYYTIKILGLNNNKLVDRRKNIINILMKQELSYIKIALINALKQKKKFYRGFYTVIKYVCEKKKDGEINEQNFIHKKSKRCKKRIKKN